MDGKPNPDPKSIKTDVEEAFICDKTFNMDAIRGELLVPPHDTSLFIVWYAFFSRSCVNFDVVLWSSVDVFGFVVTPEVILSREVNSDFDAGDNLNGIDQLQRECRVY